MKEIFILIVIGHRCNMIISCAVFILNFVTIILLLFLGFVSYIAILIIIINNWETQKSEPDVRIIIVGPRATMLLPGSTNFPFRNSKLSRESKIDIRLIIIIITLLIVQWLPTVNVNTFEVNVLT